MAIHIDAHTKGRGKHVKKTLLLTCSVRWWVQRQVGCRSSPYGGRPGRGSGILVHHGQATLWTGIDGPPASHWSHSVKEQKEIGWIWWCKGCVWSDWPTGFVCVITEINQNGVFKGYCMMSVLINVSVLISITTCLHPPNLLDAFQLPPQNMLKPLIWLSPIFQACTVQTLPEISVNLNIFCIKNSHVSLSCATDAHSY